MQKKLYGFRLHIVNGEINYVFNEYNVLSQNTGENVFEIESNFENSRCFISGKQIWNISTGYTYNRHFYFDDFKFYNVCKEDFIRAVVKEYQDVLQEIYDALVILNISKQKMIDRLTEIKNNVIDFTYVAISAKSELVIVVDEIENFDVENNKLRHHILLPSEEEPYGYSEEYDLDKVNTLLPNGNGTWQNLVFDKQPADILAIVDEYYKMAFVSLEEQHSVALSQMMKATKMQKVTPQSI